MALLEDLENHGNYLFKRRGLIPLLIVVPGLIISYYSASGVNSTYHHWHLPFELGCLFISLIGFFIRVVTVGCTPDRTSGRNTEKQLADTLNTTGMYSIVRHPLYLGNFLMWLGICLRTSSLWFTLLVCLFYWIYYERIMFAEEQFIRRKHGDQFLQWAAVTPAFIPDLRLWKPSKLDLSWRKVLRQEKNGFLVIFVIFFILKITGERGTTSAFTTEWYWTGLLVFSLVCYLVLKYLKYNTSLLNDAR